MKKVAFILKDMPGDDISPLIGGSAKAPYRVLKNLASSPNVTITDVVSFSTMEVPNEFLGITVTNLKPRLKLYFKTLYQNIAAFKKYCELVTQNDVIQCHHPHYILSLFVAKWIKKSSVKVITKAHGTAYPELKANKYKSAKGFILSANALLHLIHDRIVLRCSDVVVCSSEYQKAEMTDLYGVEEHKLQCIYNGYDSDYFSSDTTLNNNTDEIKFVFCGRCVPKKGLTYAYKLFRSVSYNLDRKTSLTFILGEENSIEDKSYYNELKNLFGNDERVTIEFGLKEPELASRFSASSIGLVTSNNYESIPSVIYEMMAVGTPVFSTYQWGVKEIIEEKFGLSLLLDKDSKKIIDYILESEVFNWEQRTEHDYNNLINKYLDNY